MDQLSRVSRSTAVAPCFEHLPDDVLQHILHYLPIKGALEEMENLCVTINKRPRNDESCTDRTHQPACRENRRAMNRLDVWLACCQTVKALPETATESGRKACCHAVPLTSRSI